MTAKEHLHKLYIKYYREEFPNFPAAMIPNPAYKFHTTNGLTRAIKDFIIFDGGWAERVNTTGRQVKTKDGRYIWIPTTGARGSADLHATIRGRSVYIEIKNERTRDRLSASQRKYAKKVRRGRGIYFVAESFDLFHKWYMETFSSML